MSSLRTSRNIYSLQVANFRYNRNEVPATGGLLFVEGDGTGVLTNDIQLASLDVVGAITAGTTITTPYLNVEDDAYIDNNLVVNQDITANSLTIATGITVTNLTVQNTLTTTDIIATGGTITTLTVGTLYATSVDASGYVIGDDLDLSGNLNVQGVANFEDAVTLEGTLDVSGNVGVGGTMTVYDLVVDTPIDDLTVEKLRAYREVVAAAGTTASFLDPSGLLTVVSNTNAENQSLHVQNLSAGAAARADVTVVSGPGQLTVGVGSVANAAGADIGSGGSATIHTSATTAGGLAIASQGTTNGHIRFYTNNGSSVGERMRIAETGAVGIGTATPATALQVAVAGSTLLSGVAVNAGDVNTLITTYNNGTTVVGALQSTRLGSAGVIGDAPEMLAVQPLGGDVVVGNAAEENVLAIQYVTGIGGVPTLAAPEKLQVLGNVLVRPGAALTGGGVTTATLTLNNAYGDNGSPQTLSLSMASSNAVIGTTGAGASVVPDIVFQMGPTEAARVTKTGSVGIATATPAASLDVSGAAIVRAGARVLTPSSAASGIATGTTIATGYMDTNALRIFDDGTSGVTLGPLTLPEGSIGPNGAALVWNNAGLDGGNGDAQLVIGTGANTATGGKFNVFTGITLNPVPVGISPQMSLDAAGNLTISGGLDAATADVTGLVTAGSANVINQINAGSAAITYTLSAGSATVSGGLTAQNVTATNNMSAGAANVTGLVTAGSATVNGTLTAQNATVTNTLTISPNFLLNYGGALTLELFRFLPVAFGVQSAGGQQNMYYPPLVHTFGSTKPLIADGAGNVSANAWGPWVVSLSIAPRIQISLYDNGLNLLGTYTNNNYNVYAVVGIGSFTSTYYSTVFI